LDTEPEADAIEREFAKLPQGEARAVSQSVQ